jgi:exopolysaccharide biosynthesis predicted pyruvyltransferase EpsI
LPYSISEFQAKLVNVLRPLVENRDLALVDFPNHSNCGDSAIWLGEELLLRELGARVVYRCDERSYRFKILNELHPKRAAILIHGGGNFGDLWRTHQEFRERIVTDHPGRRVIQLPQSIWFRSPQQLESCRRIVGSHGDFHLIVRDQQSYEFARSSFSCPTYLAPDAAFMLGALTRPVVATHSVLALARQDKEAEVGLDSEARRRGIHTVDWLIDLRQHSTAHRTLHGIGTLLPAVPFIWNNGVIGRQLQHKVYGRLAQFQVDRALRFLSSADVVVTDRLHAHILCELLGIRNIAVDTGYGKLRSLHETWITSSPTSQLATSVEEACTLALQSSQLPV